jgi:NAD-dependent histone deacetylase SIR2
MTVFLPLEESSPIPTSPSFLVPSTDPNGQVSKVIKAIIKAKRIVVVCGKHLQLPFPLENRPDMFISCKGAGISVQAGIPDFRSPEGLFQSLKRDKPRDSLASGKDLFDASVFSVSYYVCFFTFRSYIYG